MKTNFSKITVSVLAIVFLNLSGIRLLNSVIRNTYDIEYNTTFKQYLQILSPHITVQEQKQIKASWAMMNEWDDLKDNLMVLDSIAVTNNIKLPPIYKLK